MIAMAIANRPRLLIADEPTSALDVTVQAEVLALLRELQREAGMAMIMITHDLGVAELMADRVAVMKSGRIVETGSPAEVFGRPRHEYTRKLMAATPGRGTFRRSRDEDRAPLIEARDITKVYGPRSGGVYAVKDASFLLGRGDSVGIVGESGSGKSTLVNIALGLIPATSGTVLFEGKDMAAMSRDELFRFRRRVQVVFQDPTESLNPFMTAERIVLEPWRVHKFDVPRSEWPARARDLLVRVGLPPEVATRYPHQLSGGQRQRIAIARAIALRPDVLVCDEAVSALDVSTQAQILKLLNGLRDEFHLSYLFVSHDLGIVRDFCNRILVMKAGEIVEVGETAAVFERPAHPYTRRLLDASILRRAPAGDAEAGEELGRQLT
jgi:peptide/nickel transport system ATP-binding protein